MFCRLNVPPDGLRIKRRREDRSNFPIYRESFRVLLFFPPPSLSLSLPLKQNETRYSVLRCFSNKLWIRRLEAARVHDSHLAVHSFGQARAKGYTARNEFNVADCWQDKGIRSVIPDTRPIPIYRRATGNVITFGKQVAELAAGKPRVIPKYLWRGPLCRAHKRV